MNVRNVFCKVLFAVLGMLALTVGQRGQGQQGIGLEGRHAHRSGPRLGMEVAGETARRRHDVKGIARADGAYKHRQPQNAGKSRFSHEM